MTHKVAIIGAGFAGLSCARTLRRAGFSVDVFEDDLNIGGRIATARVGVDRFDHGAQYLCARSEAFQNYLRETLDCGLAVPWAPRVAGNGRRASSPPEPWFVGTPGMASVVLPLAESVRVAVGRHAQGIERRDTGWHVWFDDDTSAGPFAAVAIAVPPAEAVRLLERGGELAEALPQVRMLPCWALMVRIDETNFPEQDVFPNVSEVVRWIARDNSKPGRDPKGETLVVHASAVWSLAAELADPEDVASELWGEVSEALGLPPVRPSRMTAHLWRQGLVAQPLGKTHLYCEDSKVGLAGDWCLGSVAENAFQSGDQLGQAIAASLT